MIRAPTAAALTGGRRSRTVCKLLHEGIKAFFNEQLENDFADVKVRRYQTTEKGHGREEQRWYYVFPVPDDLPDRARWPGLKAIGVAVSHTRRNGKDCYETRYYILSRYLSAKRFAQAARGHWGIENSLHWQLDVTFGEVIRVLEGLVF